MANNHLANRVQAHKQQAKGMLSPGLRASAHSEKSSGSLPALFTHFSVGKAKEAASKMRVLDHRRMGKMQAETSKTFSQAIPQKFKEAPKLLHIKPGASSEESIWSEVPKTLPTQSSVEYKEPAQPGELRAGSVIQKFSMFPKEGQSTEDFKEQMKSVPKPKPVRRATPQKPKVDRNQRLFSRVQEVSASQQPISETDTPQRPTEQPATVKSEPAQQKTDSASTPPKQRPAVPPPAPQPQKSPPSAQEQSNEEILKSLSAAMDGETGNSKQESEQKTERPLPSAPQPKKLAKPLPAKPAPQTPKTEMPSASRTAPAAKQAKPATEKTTDKTETASPAAKARPVAKPTAPTTPTVQRKVDVPSAKPTTKPTAKPIAKPVQKPVEKSAPPVAQPKAETPRTEQITQPEQVEAHPPALADEGMLPEETTLQDASPLPETAKEIVDTHPPADMPLHRNIQARRSAPKQVKALHPETVKPAESKALIRPPQKPLISPAKYIRKTETTPPTTREPVVQRQVEPVPQASKAPASAPPLPEGFDSLDGLLIDRTAQPKAAPASSFAPHSAEPMRDSRQMFPLAKPARIVRITSQPQEQAAQLPAPLQQSLAQAEKARTLQIESREQSRLPELASQAEGQQLTKQVSVSKKNVVQRQPDGGTSASGSSEQEAAINLNQLAEDVLPYVKRILEIESERVPGDLR